MTIDNLNSAFRNCLPAVCYPPKGGEPIYYDYIKKIIYWWGKYRNDSGKLDEKIEYSCVLTYDKESGINTENRVPRENVRIVNAVPQIQPIGFVMDEKIKSIFQEKKPVTVMVKGEIKVDYERINELIFEINDDKTEIAIFCTCGEGLSAVTEPASNVKLKKKQAERINYKSVIELFNEICPELPTVQKLTESRKVAIKSAKEDGIDFASFFLKVHKSDFLSGRDGKWKNCSFDWCLKASNRVKIIEGNFDNKPKEKSNASYDIDRLDDITYLDFELEEFAELQKSASYDIKELEKIE